MNKTAYIYDAKNKSYLNTAEVYEVAGQWFFPPNSTETKPKRDKKGYVQVWNGTAWQYHSTTDLHRYAESGVAHSTVKWDYEAQEGELVLDHEATEDELVAAFPDYRKKMAEHTAQELAGARERKIAELKSERDMREIQPITTEKGSFDFDEKAMYRIQAAIMALELQGGDASVEWTLADQTTTDVTALDLRKVYGAVAARSNRLHIAYRRAKEAVNAAETILAVNAITLDQFMEA